MSDDRAHHPGDPSPGDGPAFSLEKGGQAGPGGVTYGYGAPSYGGGTDRAEGSSYDANQAKGPTTESGYGDSGYAPPGAPYDAGSGYAAPGGGYDAGSAYAPPGGDASGGYAPPSGPPPYGALAAGGPYGTPPKKKSHTGLVVGLVAGGLVLVLLVVGGIVLLASGGSSGDDTKPSAVVQTYLQALADGDAAKALAQGPKPADSTFVTDDVLKAQQEKAKITSITVSEGYTTSRSASVSATYKFGEKQADERFSLTKIGGSWKLDDVTYPIDLTSLDDVPGLTLFGIDASGKGKAYVFPGPLEWGSSNDYFTVSERDGEDFNLSPSDGSYSYFTLEADLSDAGKKAVADAVTSYITTCAASKSLTPDNCPQSEYDYEAVDGTATWTPPTDLSGLQYQTGSPVTEVYVSGDLSWSVSYTSQDFNGAQTPVTKSGIDGSIYGTVDLSKSPPTFTD